jgi:hypothetical protein
MRARARCPRSVTACRAARVPVRRPQHDEGPRRHRSGARRSPLSGSAGRLQQQQQQRLSLAGAVFVRSPGLLSVWRAAVPRHRMRRRRLRGVNTAAHPVQWLVAAFAASSAWTGALLVLDPARALAPFMVPWAREGEAAGEAAGDEAALAAALYGAAVLGEGALQLAAALEPARFLEPLLVFMSAYKLASVAACGWLAVKAPAGSARSHLGVVAACWLAPLVLLAGVRALSGPFPSARDHD